MLDFADLLTVVADGVKRKPNKKPDQQPLPSEVAIGEVMGGAEQALNDTPATYESKSAAEMGSPFLNEPQQRATAQGVADEPANVDNIETTPPNMGMQVYPRPQIATPPAPQDMPVAPKAERRKLSIDEQIAQAEDEVRGATDAPIQKQSFWKDFGAKLIQGADVFFNGTKAPIVGWGRLKHDAAVDRANAKLNPLIGMRKQQQEAEFKDAQIGKFKTDAENQIRDDNDRFLQSIRKRKYYNPSEASIAEKTRLASMGLKPEDLGKWDDRDPKTVKWGDSVWQYDNDKKAWVESGIAKDPTLKPEVYEVDETDADGKVIRDANNNPVTRKFVTTSKGAAALKEYANSRKASLRLGEDRLTETKRSNKVREVQAQKQFDEARSRWQDTMRLRAETMARKDAATAAGDVAEAQKADLDLQKFNAQLTNWRVNWKKGIGTGGFDEQDYEELTGEKP